MLPTDGRQWRSCLKCQPQRTKLASVDFNTTLREPANSRRTILLPQQKCPAVASFHVNDQQTVGRDRARDFLQDGFDLRKSALSGGVVIARDGSRFRRVFKTYRTGYVHGGH